MAKKATGFTFKNQSKLPGLMSVGHTSVNADIKLNGKKVGWIQAPWGRVSECSVWLTIKQEPTADSECLFKNIRLKHRTKSVEEMKEWLNENSDSLIKNYDFYIENK